MDEDQREALVQEAQATAQRAAAMSRAALIISCMAIAAAILGLFLPI